LGIQSEHAKRFIVMSKSYALLHVNNKARTQGRKNSSLMDKNFNWRLAEVKAADYTMQPSLLFNCLLTTIASKVSEYDYENFCQP
jgi:hypothetical protein